MPITVVQGEQRGDEGKGRFVDMLAEEHDIVARFNGGNNAGHTVVLPDGRVLKLHLVPSGIAYSHIVNVIGNGTLINPVKLIEEIEHINDNGITISKDKFKISSAAHLILPSHISEDEIREAGEGKQGSTKSGIAQVSASKYSRLGVRAEIIKNDLNSLEGIIIDKLKGQRTEREELGLVALNEEQLAKDYIVAAKLLAPYITDTTYYLNMQLNKEEPARILAEGAQAFLLDIDHGMYPFTTSSSTTVGSVSTGLGVPPMKINRVVGVSKVTQSHVGGGPFVTEILDKETLSNLHGDMTAIDAERGVTTNRTRRLGHLDLPSIRRSQMINGTTEMAITKLDWLPRYGKTIAVCVAYKRKGKVLKIAPDAAYKLEQSTPIYEEVPNWTEDIQGVRKFSNLPKNAQKYVEYIEQQTGVPITMIGVGPKRGQVIVR